jgi:hypothetical protein
MAVKRRAKRASKNQKMPIAVIGLIVLCILAVVASTVLLLQPRAYRSGAQVSDTTEILGNGFFGFTENFSSDSLKDASSTADWDTLRGELALTTGTESFVKADNTTPGINNIGAELGSSAFFIDFSRMAIDDHGYPHIVWPDDSNGGIGNVQYITWGGSGWVNAAGDPATTTNTAVSTDPAFAGRPDVELDNADRPGVAWLSSLGIEFARWDPTSETWHGMASTTGPDLIAPGFGQPQFEFDSNDFPVITWGEPTSHVTRWNGTTYTNMAGVPGTDIVATNGGTPQLELDANDNPHVVAVEDPAGPVNAGIRFTKWMGTAIGWVGNLTSDGNPATVDTDNFSTIFGHSFGNVPDIALTPDDRDGIAWVGTADGVSGLFTTVWNGSDAYVKLDDTPGTNMVGASSSGYPEIEYTSDSRQTVSWLEAPEGTANIYFVEQNGTSFVGADGAGAATVVNSEPIIGTSYFDMDLDCQDNPAIVWGDLFFAGHQLDYTHWIAPHAASGVATSKTIDTTSEKILSATLSVTEDALCSEGSTIYELSNDGGATWSVVTPGVTHNFTQSGSNLMWRASLSSNSNPGESPIIDSLSIEYSTQALSTRISGDNPIELAINISQAAFPNGNAPVVVLGRSDNLVDEFVATPLVSLINASLLLTPPSELDARTLTEIKRVLASNGRVYVLGGDQAISPAVVAALNANGISDVARLGGETRRETATAIGSEIVARSSAPITKAYLSEDIELVDAFTVGPVTGDKTDGAVDIILLSKRSDPTLHASAYSFLNAHSSITALELIGGDAALPLALNADIQSRLPALTLSRSQGVNRFDTNRVINNAHFASPTVAVLANGQREQIPGAIEATSTGSSGLFTALLAGAFASRFSGPLVLVQAAQLPVEAQQYLTSHAATLETLYIVGSTNDISASVEQAAKALI